MYLIVSTLIAALLQPSGWEIFANTQFKLELVEELGFEIEMPIFDEEVIKKDGKEITLTGFYLPIKLDDDRILISQLPYANCFFCGGGGGQETIAEVVFKTPPRRFRIDELLTVKGRLKLNVHDYDHPVFMIVDASTL